MSDRLPGLEPEVKPKPPDPFFEGHPSLNHRDVKVSAADFPGAWTFTERWIHWRRLTPEERLELERLLAKAAGGFRPVL